MADTRFRKLAIAVLALFAGYGIAQSPQAPNSQPSLVTEHTADAYAIYSLLLAHQQSRGGPPLAIGATTVSGDDIKSDPDRELLPALDDAHAFYEAMQAFHEHREQQVQLQHEFKIDQRYVLLTDEQVADFGKNISAGGYTHLVRFSEVYFNPAQTAALVYIDNACASCQASGGWAFLEKRDGQWVRRSSSTADNANTYAIYSLLMPGVPFQTMSPSQAPHFAIAAQTVNIDDMNPAIPPDGQLQPPPNNAQAFREAVQDFYTRQYERTRIADQLRLDRPYTLLDAAEIAELKETLAGIDPGSELKDKWAGYPGITYFSEVYFDSTHTAALVYMNNFCANLCANGQWIYLEKRGKLWVLRSGLNV
jgi:hypothetical protein